MKNIVSIIMLLILFSSCVSKLKVTVKSADREIVLKESEKYVKEDVERGITALQNFYYNWDGEAILNRMYDSIEKADSSQILPASKIEYKELFNSRFSPLLQSLKDLTNIADKAYKDNKNYEALSNINMAGKIIFKIQDALKNYNVTLIPSEPAKIIVLKSEIVEQTSTIVSGTLRTKFPILGDPMVSFLTKKENNDIWKSCYNKTVSKNFFGNADIAFILRSNPPEKEVKTGDYNNNFTIKGVRLDSNDATNALLTGLTQTLNFVANTQGIPLNIGQQQDAKDPIPVQNTLVTGLSNDKIALENKKKKLADYRKMLVEKIISENIDRRSGVDLTSAIQRIETFWATLKTELIK